MESIARARQRWRLTPQCPESDAQRAALAADEVATSDHQSQQPGANPVAAVSSEPADQPQSVDCGSLTQIEPLRGRPAGSHDQQPVSVGHAEAVHQSFSADSFGRSEPAGSFVGPFDSFGGAIQPLRQSESAADFVSVEPLARGLGAELD